MTPDDSLRAARESLKNLLEIPTVPKEARYYALQALSHLANIPETEEKS